MLSEQDLVAVLVVRVGLENLPVHLDRFARPGRHRHARAGRRGGKRPVLQADDRRRDGGLGRRDPRHVDYRREEDVYDALAASVTGQLLAELYVQVRRGLQMQEEGGAVARINAVEIVAGDVKPPPTGRTAAAGAFAFTGAAPPAPTTITEFCPP